MKKLNYERISAGKFAKFESSILSQPRFVFGGWKGETATGSARELDDQLKSGGDLDVTDPQIGGRNDGFGDFQNGDWQ